MSTIEELQQEITKIKDSTQKQVDALKLAVSEMQNKRPLDRYIDNESKDIIKDTITEGILDIVWNDYFYYQTYFESLDGWNLIDTGSSSVSRLGVALQTGASSGNESSIDKEPVYQNVLSFDQESRFASAIFVTTVSNVEGFIGIGEVNNGATGVHYGFFYQNATLKGSCADGTTQSTVDLLTLSTNHPTTVDPIFFIEAHFFPGYKVEFFVKTDAGDLISKGTITDNIPSGAMFEWLGARVKTTTAGVAELRFGFMEYLQRRGSR